MANIPLGGPSGKGRTGLSERAPAVPVAEPVLRPGDGAALQFDALL